ncbi:MAG TPA: response regulator [Pyrinomonadaceae bacterium]|jgi:CheY-like chemotaxis protein|nr:response regulator [Pyrinomonadaceae bacterium]
MNCPECAHQNPGNAKFCVKCGYQFGVAPGVVTTVLPSSYVEDFPADDDEQATGPVTTGGGTQKISRKDFLVLVVDDMVDNLVLISLHLQQSGYRVVTASDGEEALRVADITPPDIILMDISMPELDGLGATRKLREHPTLKEVPVIALTAFNTEGFRRAAYDVGIDGYLTKPIDFDRLYDLVRSLLPVK